MSSQDTGIVKPSKTERGVQHVGLQIDEKSVADYLRRHPDFFDDKPSLLNDLRVPHQTGSAVSLVERQVAALRESNENRQAQLDGLIQIARDNELLNFHLHQLTLQLMRSDGLQVLLKIISDRLKQDFDADLAVIHLLFPPQETADLSLPEMVTDTQDFINQFQHVFNSGKPYCGRQKDEQLQLLFGDRAQGIASCALLPLGRHSDSETPSGKESPVGLLVIGSLDRGRFTIGTDTDFLARMAEVITAALGKYLKKAPA